MATITTKSIEPDKEHGGVVVVSFEARTSTGRFTFPFAVDDQGSMAANEKKARDELRIFLEEALKVLERQQ